MDDVEQNRVSLFSSDSRLERFWIWLAWRLPRGLVYWCAIRLTSNNWLTNPDARKVTEALTSWRENKPKPKPDEPVQEGK